MTYATRIRRFVPLTVLFVGVAACGDSGVGPDHIPDGVSTSLQVQRDVEAMIGGALAGWWRASHGPRPGAALSVAADAHTSSWRNWGMFDVGGEPRQALVTDPDSHFQFITQPWTELYRTLLSVRDGLIAIEQGAELGDGGSDTERAVAFARFLQGMALGQLAVLFDEAFIVDETTDPASVQRSPHPDVIDAALAQLGRAIAVAETNDFTIPAEWIGFNEPMDSDGLARLARSFRARYRMGVARTAGERAAVDWVAVLADAEIGITEDWASHYDGNWEVNWAWGMDKLFAGVHPLWGRLDYRTVGPADASGGWQAWINAAPHDRRPFLIDTDDRRITGGSPTAAGSYVFHDADILFRPERGVEHFSYYADGRWSHLWEAEGVGDYIDFPVEELDFMRAEALYRLGQVADAMAIVNAWRGNGALPAFEDPAGLAPGGERCVPRMPDGSCGDLWEALKYEKRIELFHYGPFTEYLDDRGWGDLVAGTFLQLQAPEGSFDEILAELYGEDTGSASASVAADFSVEGIHRKRMAYEAYDRDRNANPGDVGAG